MIPPGIMAREYHEKAICHTVRAGELNSPGRAAVRRLLEPAPVRERAGITDRWHLDIDFAKEPEIGPGLGAGAGLPFERNPDLRQAKHEMVRPVRAEIEHLGHDELAFPVLVAVEAVFRPARKCVSDRVVFAIHD